MSVIEINENNFSKEVLECGKPVLIDFWAPWCGPCRMMGPVIEEIAGERIDIKVGKINIDDCQQLAVKYQISSIPSFLIFKNGTVAGQLLGVVPKEKLLDQLQ
ncbi:MAG: thioredoxin [Spirochaetes bacterium GWF1_41_5]|nr:MAG: thioredoxin [Spirochaetes bacterium GWF1_41_5]HBE02737.1 thioredoxin [Spirochaetia bacterium]